MSEVSLYIHIPFCRNKCIYCNFYSEYYKESAVSYYIPALLKQIAEIKTRFKSIYVGGGTPTVLPAKYLYKLLRSLKPLMSDCCEFTVEANPESLDDEKLSILKYEGVNRLSIGVQSFNINNLKKMGRIHDVLQAENAVTKAKEKGFNNINIDLIFGVWGETMDEWTRDLECAVKLPVTHLSCYSMICEKNTPLMRLVENGSIRLSEDDLPAEMYRFAIDYLPEQGFCHYEVSNFAKDNYVCGHNMHYWENNSYMAIGPSSVSYLNGVRQANISDVFEYIERVNKGASTVLYSERLESLQKAKETAALKIRTASGIDWMWFERKTGFEFLNIEKNAISELEGDGLIKYNKQDGEIKGVHLTKKGFMFCDTVSSALL
jgi:oxygen-independent coproporphyrinogen-3 oxidase